MSASHARDIPSWLTDGVASAATAPASNEDRKLAFKTAVEDYLETRIITAGGNVKYLYRDESYVEALVTDLRGWVIDGSNQWEKVQISFALLGASKARRIRIFVDGMLASGLGNSAPPDTRFVYSMEPEHSLALTNFSQAMLDEFVNQWSIK